MTSTTRVTALTVALASATLVARLLAFQAAETAIAK